MYCFIKVLCICFAEEIPAAMAHDGTPGILVGPRGGLVLIAISLSFTLVDILPVQNLLGASFLFLIEMVSFLTFQIIISIFLVIISKFSSSFGTNTKRVRLKASIESLSERNLEVEGRRMEVRISISDCDGLKKDTLNDYRRIVHLERNNDCGKSKFIKFLTNFRKKQFERRKNIIESDNRPFFPR